MFIKNKSQLLFSTLQEEQTPLLFTVHRYIGDDDKEKGYALVAAGLVDTTSLTLVKMRVNEYSNRAIAVHVAGFWLKHACSVRVYGCMPAATHIYYVRNAFLWVTKNTK